MGQIRASLRHGLVNELARGGEANEIYVVKVFVRNPHLLDPTRNVSWDGVRADRHNDSPRPRYSSRSPSGDQAIRETEETG